MFIIIITIVAFILTLALLTNRNTPATATNIPDNPGWDMLALALAHTAAEETIESRIDAGYSALALAISRATLSSAQEDNTTDPDEDEDYLDEAYGPDVPDPINPVVEQGKWGVSYTSKYEISWCIGNKKWCEGTVETLTSRKDLYGLKIDIYHPGLCKWTPAYRTNDYGELIQCRFAVAGQENIGGGIMEEVEEEGLTLDEALAMAGVIRDEGGFATVSTDDGEVIDE